MSLQEISLKSSKKMIMKINGEIKQLRAEFGKGQKDLFYEIRELKDQLTTKKKKVIVLKDTVSCISSGFEKVKNENETMKNQKEVLKGDNNRFTKKMFDMEENDKPANTKLNQI